MAQPRKELRKKFPENKHSSKAGAIEECLAQITEERNTLLGNITFRITSQFRHLDEKNLLNLSSIGDVLATQIDFYDKRAEQSQEPNKSFYKERSDIFTTLLYQYEEMQNMPKNITDILKIFKNSKIINSNFETKIKKELQIANTTLFSLLDEYINLFNSGACGSDEDRLKIRDKGKELIEAFSKYKLAIKEIEENIIEKAFQYIKEHPIYSNDRKIIMEYISNSHARRMKSGIDSIMILSDLLNITPPTDISETNGTPLNSLPKIDENIVKAQRNEKMNAIQESAKAMQKTFTIFSTLANPSIFSEQGMLEKTRKIHKKAQEVTMPKWVNSMMKWAEGDTDIPDYFKKFGESNAFTNYQKKIKELSNPKNEIFIALQNPTPENKTKIANFFKELQKNETEYLKEFSNLIDSLARKGAHSQLLADILGTINKYKLEIAGSMISIVLLWKSLKYIKIGVRFFFRKVLTKGR